MIMQKLAYDGKFEGNILVVGRTECGKTSFIERLAVNNVFGKLTKIKWVSQISLSKQREAQIQSNFDCPLSFQYPKNVEELDSLLEELKTKTADENDTDSAIENIYGIKKKNLLTTMASMHSLVF